MNKSETLTVEVAEKEETHEQNTNPGSEAINSEENFGQNGNPDTVEETVDQSLVNEEADHDWFNAMIRQQFFSLACAVVQQVTGPANPVLEKEAEEELNTRNLKSIRDEQLKVVYWQLKANRSLDEALKDEKIPIADQEDFVNELTVKYPDAKDYIS